jgi:GntP family gluconate:H+ symporter
MDSDYWPFVIFATSVVLIVRLRFHPFIALILSAIFVGLMSPGAPVTALELPLREFGGVAGNIAWVIALAALIGTAMMKSGAAEQIVNWLLRTLGPTRGALALVLAGFILSIPVFFDTVFFLLIPVGIALARATGKDFVRYVIAISGGAAISHSLVPPTPGPLIMAETLQVDLGVTMLAGLGASVLSVVTVLVVARRVNDRLRIPLHAAFDDAGKHENPPSVFLSFMPIFVPVAMISCASIANMFAADPPAWVAFAGNKNLAMAVGAAIALLLWARSEGLTERRLWEACAHPLEVAGVIILITSAGGAYGAMLRHSGIGDAITKATEGIEVNYVLLAWCIAAFMKTAQGSSTVAMITASAIMISLLGPEAELPYHPVYILLATGFGAMVVSWMNDSGFWIVSRMSGFNETETLQTWTLTFSLVGVVGLIQVLILSWLVPLV